MCTGMIKHVAAWVAIALGVVGQAPSMAAEQGTMQAPLSVERRVLAFYYPWYGIATGPGGANCTTRSTRRGCSLRST